MRDDARAPSSSSAYRSASASNTQATSDRKLSRQQGGGGGAIATASSGRRGGGGGADTAPPLPRVRMHADSSQVESLLNPVRGIRDAQLRAGVTPTDHARQNVAAVRAQSRANAERRQAERDAADDAAVWPPWQRPPLQQQQQQQGALGGGSGALAARRQRRSSSDGGGGRDFVAENRAAAGAAAAAAAAGAAAALARLDGGSTATATDGGATFLAKPDYGRMPEYLLRRRLELAARAEAQAAAREAALIPGMRLLPEDERQDALRVLGANREEVERALRALPLVTETAGQRRRRDELERRLAEIEKAARAFGRPRVLVRV